ncbi:hypothetical [Prochlorococcus marinus str. MIT 9313]|uniref:Nif11 domain-containing protein n=1 Tax=Prochlorococcus marinus (strain MIT 9313) TaxID=74547 RepID=Q7V729_PROMM|nr:Nif11-like leader peptide family natural product precursor [Prochlorococcus marinus]CAE21108.1 hypothetical [Prochlorococcus marinus str. MIT 9313]
MSEEQLKALIAKVQADTSLQEQLKAEGADVVAIAKAAGFSITTEDLKEHRQTLSVGRQTLSESELEGLAGGGGGARTKTANVPSDLPVRAPAMSTFAENQT